MLSFLFSARELALWGEVTMKEKTEGGGDMIVIKHFCSLHEHSGFSEDNGKMKLTPDIVPNLIRTHLDALV